MRILVAGGAGYVGSRLVPELLESGHEVVVLDLYLYGEEVLSPHPRLLQIKGDVRDLFVGEKALEGCDAVIHLACISNDPSFELNPALGKSINLDSFEPFVRLAKKKGSRRFIYASSSSVYGIKKEEHVVEEMGLDPLTDYSRFKGMCETILLNYQSDQFVCTILRPATVCGYSARQRLDLVVNILTNCAYHIGRVRIMGGEQMRPNIHIADMVRAYLHILAMPEEKVQGQIFNVGTHNHTIFQLGKMVAELVGKKRAVELVLEPANDLRSYRISSQKIERCLGFKPLFSIEEAIGELIDAFMQNKLPNSLDDKRYFNIKTMKESPLQ